MNEYGSVEDYQINPPEQRYGGLVKINYEPTSWLKLYEEVTLERNKENSEIPDYGPSQTDGTVIPANNPYNPWGVPLQPIGDALLEFGPQKQVVTIDTVTSITGAIIQLPHNWFIEPSYAYSESDGDRITYNQISRTGLQQALNGQLPGFIGTYYNPFVDFSAVMHPIGGFVNQITQLNPQQVLDDESQFPGLVQRLPNGQINYVNDPFVNLGAVLIDGIDFGASYVTKEYNWGKLNIEVNASYM